MATRRLQVLLPKRLSEVGIILRSICAEAGWRREPIFVETKEEVGEALKAHRPDLGLLDVSLLQPEAAQCVHVLYLENSRVPLIIFAEPDDATCVEECLSNGARNYLLEGFMDERTVARVLQVTTGGMGEEALVPGRQCWEAGQPCQCSMQAEVFKRNASPSVRWIPEETQEELVRALKQKG